MRKVGIGMLTNNMVLVKPIYHAGKLMLKAGVNNLDRYKNEFTKLGITFAYIEDVNSEGIEIPDVLSQELRTESKEKLRDVIQTYEKRSIVNVAALNSVAKNIVEEIYYAPDVSISLSDISSKDDELVRHCVDVAVYSVLIGKGKEYDRAMLQKLIFGALLHDIGVAKLNPKLFMKREPWNKEEMNEYKTHAQIGYEALKKVNDITELSKIIVLSHHERLNGSGYPDRKKGEAIHELVRIVSIADEFDALVLGNAENHTKKYSVNQAMETLMKESTDKLDAALLAFLMKKIAIYPNGSLVKLSNNCLALVQEQNKDMPYRPILRIITDEAGKPIKAKEVNLIKELSLTIKDSEMENSLTS